MDCFEYKYKKPDTKKHDVIVIGGGIPCFSTGAQISALIHLSEVAKAVAVSMEEFVTFSSSAFEYIRPVRQLLTLKNYLHDECFNAYNDFEDNGPKFDNRSWAFLEKQQNVFEKQFKNKKYLFPIFGYNKLKLFKLKSMDSRSGYRGVKRIKK